jgi:hypothetical protein
MFGLRVVDPGFSCERLVALQMRFSYSVQNLIRSAVKLDRFAATIQLRMGSKPSRLETTASA